jgi:hypothetical protein
MREEQRRCGFAPGFRMPQKAAAVSKTDNTFSSTRNQSSYSFSSQSIGTAATGRIIVVGASTAGGSTLAPAITSVTIAGNAAAEAIQVATGIVSGNVARGGLYALQVNTGTTATIVVTFSGNVSRCGIGVWAIYGAGSTTAVDTASDVAGGDLTT